MRKLRKERRTYLQRWKQRRRRGGLFAARRRRDFHFRCASCIRWIWFSNDHYLHQLFVSFTDIGFTR
ncbi:hypothetical protein GLYMA_12G125550v4 [Glycine max]|nr:hypothetical protein GLYMA_12G125550v4 [Glycine max]KAH1142879.1 hypothetical protein GYH30_033539 [Glycine max]